MEERKPWEQMEKESSRWFGRFSQFRLMKPWERSVNAVFVEEEKTRKDEKRREEATGSWYQKAKEWKWEERAAAYDKHRLDERDRRLIAKEAEVMSIPYAQRYERVRSLDYQAHEGEKPYVDEGTGRTYLLWSNPERLREWRGILDDIAKEVSGRVKKQELTGKDGAPLVGGIAFYDAVQLPQKQALQEGGDPIASSSQP